MCLENSENKVILEKEKAVVGDYWFIYFSLFFFNLEIEKKYIS